MLASSSGQPQSLSHGLATPPETESSEPDEKAFEAQPDTKNQGYRRPSSTQHPEPSDWSKHTLRKRPWRRRVTEFTHIVEARYRGSGTQGDPFIVQWLDHDPENPKNFSNLFKWTITFLLAFMTLCTSLASSAYTGAAGQIIPEFHCSTEVFLLGLSLMVIGFAVGPLVWAPLSEAIARRDILLIAFGIYIIFTAVCAAAHDIATLIVLRFLSGTFGSAAFVIPAGQISDMFEAEQRGMAQAVFAAAPFLGPTLGPTVGGFLSPAGGWRWLFGFLALYAATLTVAGFFFVPETYPPVLLRRRAKLLSQVTGKVYMTKIDLEQPLVFKEVVKRSLARPWLLLFTEPIVLLLSVSCKPLPPYLFLYHLRALTPVILDLHGRGLRHIIPPVRRIPDRLRARLRLERGRERACLSGHHAGQPDRRGSHHHRQQTLHAHISSPRRLRTARGASATRHVRRRHGHSGPRVVRSHGRSERAFHRAYPGGHTVWHRVHFDFHVLFKLSVRFFTLPPGSPYPSRTKTPF